MAVYNIDENFTPVLLSAMHTCFMPHLLVSVLVLVLALLVLALFLKELVLVSVLVLLQLVLTTTLVSTDLFISFFGNDCCLVIHVRFIVHFCKVVFLTVIYVYFLLQSCVHYSVVCQ